MKRSIDIQRLLAPTERPAGKLERLLPSLAFGGGLRNGGLSDEAMGLLADICSFDYMGAAEFEFGALPEALSRMLQSGPLDGFKLDVELPKKRSVWVKQHDGECKDTVYVLCPAQWRDEVVERVERFAQGDTAGTRERVVLEESIRVRAKGEEEPRIIGWIELQNGYMFFIDETMWRGFCKLFGVKPLTA